MNFEISKSSKINRIAFSPIEKRVANEIFNQLMEIKNPKLISNNLLKFHTKMRKYMKQIDNLKIRAQPRPIKIQTEVAQPDERIKSPSKAYRIKTFQKRCSQARFVISDLTQRNMISSFESNPRRILSVNGTESRKSYQNSQGENQEISVDIQLIKQVSEFVRKNSCLVKSRRALNQETHIVENSSDSIKSLSYENRN